MIKDKKKLLPFAFAFFFHAAISADELKPIIKPVITGEMASEIARKTMEAATQESKYITVTVVDSSGQTLAVLRHHNAGVHTVQASYKKAYTANSQKQETAKIRKEIVSGEVDANGETVTPEDIRYLNDNFSFMDGGVPIFYNDIVIGAVGVGGAHGSEDVRFAKKGISSVIKENE